MESLECLVKFWKRITTVRVTDSALVCRHSCFLFSAIIKGDGAGTMEVDIYDGHDTDGEIKVSLRRSAADTMPISFNPPAYFSKGLYIYHRGNMQSATVQFMIEPD